MGKQSRPKKNFNFLVSSHTMLQKKIQIIGKINKKENNMSSLSK